MTGRDLKGDRLNRAKQMKEQKRNELFLQRRIGEFAETPIHHVMKHTNIEVIRKHVFITRYSRRQYHGNQSICLI